METRHEDDCRSTFEVNLLRFAAHQGRQLIVRDLDHQLAGTHRRDDVLTQRFLFHLVGKLLRRLVVHIGFQQRFADIFYGLRDVNLSDAAFALKNLKTSF